MLYIREAELKHGRVAMLATAGFLVAESFHPLFGGAIDVPSYVAFQASPLETFWPIVVGVLFLIEAASGVVTFENPLEGGWWTLKADHSTGDLGFAFHPRLILENESDFLNIC
jgi:light-harvesting complex I chlorophyll a/b binding protein 4